jgi:hypothetical protein
MDCDPGRTLNLGLSDKAGGLRFSYEIRIPISVGSARRVLDFRNRGRGGKES